MKIETNKLKSENQNIVLTIGNFDGLHLGHRKILDHTMDLAKKWNAEAAVLTFFPHPVQVLYPEKEMKRLFDIYDQEQVLNKIGIDLVMRENFDFNFAQMSASDFLYQYLFEGLKSNNYSLKAIVVGSDFAFGRSRSGNIDYLKSECAKLNIEVQAVEAVTWQSKKVSSSRIREALEQGHINEVKELLSRPYYLRGKVIEGVKRGRGLGVPTANMSLQNVQNSGVFVPKSGVYFSNCEIEGQVKPSVTNIGWNPTFNSDLKNYSLENIKVETHILDFNETIYEKTIKVELHSWIRPELKFNSADELLKQIRLDVQTARRLAGP